MKRNYARFLLGLTSVFVATGAMAVNAKSGPISFIQPDGSLIEIILHGDEGFHYATTTDGRLLRVCTGGGYEEATGLSIKSLMAEARPRYRYSESAFPTIGSPHSLVILVEYPDHGFNTVNPKEYFDDFLNGDNFTRDNATGSCREYYINNSLGAFVPTFDVYGPVMMKNKRSYYGGGYYETNACQMVVEAVEALDDIIDFSQYDHNGDGYVDSVYIIYADKGEADSGIPETVWPYSWELEGDGIDLWADGVKINTYACSNELQGDGDMEGIGTFIHEFGHVLGLPDLYNTEKSGDITTPKSWSVMDSGNFLNDNRTPCNFSSFERYSLGWLDADELVASGIYSMGNLSETNKAFMITSEEDPDEFFMMEYRLQEGWDRYLRAQGMLIWHIKFDQELWDLNEVNNNKLLQRVHLVRADNNSQNTTASSKGDVFPGSLGVTTFSNETIPALKTWGGEDLNVTSISDIMEGTDRRIHFTATLSEFRGDSDVEETVSVPQQLAIYDITGRYLGTTTFGIPTGLAKGIYIVGGKKIMIE